MDYFKTMLNVQNIHNKKKVPKTYRTPTLPAQQEIDEHRGLTKQSITQIDYAFIKNDNDKYNATVLRICESTKGLGYATVVDYKGLHPRAIKAIMRFLIENGLQSTILQSDGEKAILELLIEIMRQLPHVKMQTSPPHSHQSQGCVERCHQTLFAQLRTIQFSNLNLSTMQLGSTQHQLTVHYSTIYYITQHGFSTDI
eukprot:2468407-Amphidinium_carterae.1